MSACNDRAVAKFAWESFEGISTALGTIGGVLSLGNKIPHPVAQAVGKVGVGAGLAAGGARYIAKKYRDEYDRLESACPQQPGPDANQPTSPRPSGGGGGGSFGGGAVSGGWTPQFSWTWQAGRVTDDGAGGVIVEAGRWVLTWRPIVFDLGNDGFDFRTSADPIFADAEHDGVVTARTWIGATDGILVYDYNQNGIGETAEWALTSFAPGAADDLEALRTFDSNRDGGFSAGDTEFHKFRIGIDANQDGLLTAGELHPLSNFGFNYMALTEGYDVQKLGGEHVVPGIRFDYAGNVIRTDGSYLEYAAVGFTDVAAPVQIHHDATATILSQDGAKTIFWNGGAVDLSVSSFSYAGHSGYANFFSGSGNDILRGDTRDNGLYGGAGVDQLYGGEGNDVLFADAADLASGIVKGGIGFDTLVLDGFVPTTVYAAQHEVDALVGGEWNDILSGEGAAARTYLVGNAGDDLLVGSSFDDSLFGGSGTDQLRGGAGSDLYQFGSGSGTDIIDDAGGDADKVITDLSVFAVSSFAGSGADQVITFQDGSRLVLKNGRLGQGIEAVEFSDYTYTRDDINTMIDFQWTGTYQSPDPVPASLPAI